MVLAIIEAHVSDSDIRIRSFYRKGLGMDFTTINKIRQANRRLMVLNIIKIKYRLIRLAFSALQK
jgi:hypothetical protein